MQKSHNVDLFQVSDNEILDLVASSLNDLDQTTDSNHSDASDASLEVTGGNGLGKRVQGTTNVTVNPSATDNTFKVSGHASGLIVPNINTSISSSHRNIPTSSSISVSVNNTRPSVTLGGSEPRNMQSASAGVAMSLSTANPVTTLTKTPFCLASSLYKPVFSSQATYVSGAKTSILPADYMTKVGASNTIVPSVKSSESSVTVSTSLDNNPEQAAMMDWMKSGFMVPPATSGIVISQPGFGVGAIPKRQTDANWFDKPPPPLPAVGTTKSLQTSQAAQAHNHLAQNNQRETLIKRSDDVSQMDQIVGFLNRFEQRIDSKLETFKQSVVDKVCKEQEPKHAEETSSYSLPYSAQHCMTSRSGNPVATVRFPPDQNSGFDYDKLVSKMTAELSAQGLIYAKQKDRARDKNAEPNMSYHQ